MRYNELTYAGIGSRKTPTTILLLMQEFAAWAKELEFTCATGGAEGADTAFIKGAGLDHVDNWLPFDRYNGYRSDLPFPCERSLKLAKKFHPNWDACDAVDMLMHARNCNITLGRWFNNPVQFILCWTIGGMQTGGTGQALRIADAYNIPVCNLGIGDPIAKIAKLKEDILEALDRQHACIFGDFNLVPTWDLL